MRGLTAIGRAGVEEALIDDRAGREREGSGGCRRGADAEAAPGLARGNARNLVLRLHGRHRPDLQIDDFRQRTAPDGIGHRHVILPKVRGLHVIDGEV